MGKRRTRLLPASQSPPAAITVENPAEVTMRVLKVIREVLRDKSVQFEGIELANNEVKFALSGTSTKGTARDKYSVFLLLQMGDELFWLGSYLIFKRALGRYELLSVGLIIFKGEAVDEKKTALLRAEWDNQSAGTIHAQPHWHVYPRFPEKGETDAEIIEGMEVESIESLDDNVETKDYDLEWPTSANFHYAMASRWHTSTKVNSHQEKLNDVDNLLSWIRGCVSYCNEQLRYLSN
jgi:hypothetical protein